MTELKELSFEQLCAKGSSYLVEAGYTQVYDMNIGDGMFYVYPEISGDMATMCPGCSQLIMIGQTGYQGIFGKCDTKENRETTINNLLFGASTSPIINTSNEDNYFFVVLETGSAGGPEQSRIDLSSVNLEEALNEENYSSFEDYLTQNGYTNTNQSLQDFMMSKPPVEYKFATGTGADTPFPDEVPVKSCSKVVLISQFYYDGGEQKAGYYLECSDEEHAEDVSNYFLDAAGDSLINHQTYGTAVFIAMYTKGTSGDSPDSPTVSRRSLLLRSVISTSGTHTVEIAPYNKYGEGPKAGVQVDIQGYSYTKDQDAIKFYYQGKDVTEILSCGNEIEVVLTAMDKMLPESIVVNNVVDYTYTRYDNKQQGFITVSEPKGEVSFVFGELPDYESSATINKFTLQTTDGKIKQSFETELSNWKDFASKTDGFAYDGQIKYTYGDTTYVVNELTADGGYAPVTGDSAIRNGSVYYLIESESNVEYSFRLTDTNGVNLGIFASDVDDWTTFASREDNAFSIDVDTEEQYIVYNPGNGTYTVQYVDATGVTVLVKVGDKISASNVYKIPYVKHKTITLQIVDGGSHTINTTANTFADLANELDYITADEGSEYVTYTDTKTQTTYKLGDSNYNLWDPSDTLSYTMTVYCLTDENIANGPAVTFTLKKTDDAGIKQSITTNTNKWSIYVTQEDNNFSESADGYVKYTYEDVEYFIGREGKADDGSVVYNKVLTSSNIVRGTYYIVADESLLA